jgi:hypothetical protein
MASVTTGDPLQQAVRDSQAALRERTRNLVEASPADVIQSDLAAEIRAYLDGLSVDQLLCLAYGHTWGILIPGQPVPRGFRAVPDPEVRGVYLVTETCIRLTPQPSRRRPLVFTCGASRRSQTLPRGLFDRSRKRSYDYDGNTWEVRPPGSRLTRLDFLDEIWRRMGRDLFPESYAGQPS